jgi:predicted peptidase
MPPSAQVAKHFSAKITTAVSAQYLLFLPKDYDQDRRKRWPLMVFLHGAGERGTNTWLVAKHGPPKIVASQPDFPFILVSPQCPAGQRWSNDIVLALIDQITKAHRVDRKRVYLTGLSMGGYGTWSLGLSYPERFAAIAPICGGGDPVLVLLPDPKKLQALKSLPIWAFHGAKDSVVRLDESERMVKAVQSVGGNVRLTVYPDADHDSWTETYNNPQLYEWFLSHERRNPPTAGRR